MSGLEALVNLVSIDIHDNKITEIKGINNLTNLQAINLAKNQISSLLGYHIVLNWLI